MSGGIITFDFEDTGYFDGTSPNTYVLINAANSWNTGFSLSQFQAINVGPGGIYGAGSGFMFANGGKELEFVVVPEPATWGLLIGGASLLMGLRRKRRLAAAAKDASITNA